MLTGSGDTEPQAEMAGSHSVPVASTGRPVFNLNLNLARGLESTSRVLHGGPGARGRHHSRVERATAKSVLSASDDRDGGNLKICWT
jgi:hypothetical protein